MAVLTAYSEEGRGNLFIRNIEDVLEWLEWAASSAGERCSARVVGFGDKVILLCSSTWVRMAILYMSWLCVNPVY
jgi:hypothetical protein